ncbi:BlaI/MecI/CopY family transcriptional regulator [Spirosoma sp. KNUC1025]|uniref:BlaI/MecI/CopY family transcriptional regulator n=1 Tax=Spirosoma sp. KNUC1025 TaxID=2894082 RepID=UPI001E4C9598|nr:BlaI/MecI/CopY family transcriptional regulator [Spirosoma sp. KNUC1025]UFH57862.1 BlaI/MecI/CopY family transcriptional regulator [Spirosoma sp. KNUC1025]
MTETTQENDVPGEPTKSELEILQILWEFGPSTARFVNDHLNQHIRKVIYMSTLKLMQIMVEKGFLTKDESQMKHIYRAVVEESKTKSLLLDRVVDTLFNGSASNLMMQLVGSKKLSPDDIKTIQKLIKKLDQKP